MNLIIPESGLFEENGWFPIKDFRRIDYDKIESILHNMYRNISLIDPNFKYEIEFTEQSSPYLEDGATFYRRLRIYQEFNESVTTLSVLIPRLIQDNFFVMNGSYYVPLLFLEKAPIDRILDHEKNSNKIFINMNPVYNYTFDFHKKTVQFRSKNIAMDVFFRVLFSNDKDYLEYLREIGLVEKTGYTKADFKKFMKSFMDFYKWDTFNDAEVLDWLDKFLILDYYREIFIDYYGIDNLGDIIKEVVRLYVEDEPIDMATLSNRRLIMMEYLIRPLFEIYTRLLYGVIDKKSQNFLPTVNEYVVVTTGFRKLLHGGQLYDISNPYPLPLINKVSQGIIIIKNDRIPKSWQRNDKSSFGVICPISVSPQAMAVNLVFTSSAKVNKLGRLNTTASRRIFNETE